MTTFPCLVGAAWRKSSYSDGGDNNCVEVSDGFPGAVPVPAEAWSAFIGGVKDARLG
ncbi:DUF397 domain-containing protein [Streptomyces sp. NPDC058773]|uniref:DUF397 domain-containing protein n=1 Tax=Streptomyces sp. NPDC058773 TaxID=3346632 RepID=UPI0036B8D27F